MMHAPACLEHLKPHKPLLRPAVNHTTNNIRHMVNNNLRFNFTVIVKNNMPRHSFLPLVKTENDEHSRHYRELPFERYGFVMSDYEMYLHVSRLKNAYQSQKSFIHLFQRRQSTQNQFLETLHSTADYDIYAPLPWNPGGVPPSIYYVTPRKEAAEERIPGKIAERTEAVTETREREHTVSPVTVYNTTPSGGVNVNAIVGEVSRVFEEKLRAERLRKG